MGKRIVEERLATSYSNPVTDEIVADFVGQTRMVVVDGKSVAGIAKSASLNSSRTTITILVEVDV